jgi:hypothetical protein
MTLENDISTPVGKSQSKIEIKQNRKTALRM